MPSTTLLIVNIQHLAFRARPSRSQTRQASYRCRFLPRHRVWHSYEQPCSYSLSALALSLSERRQLSTTSASTMRDDDLVAPRNSCAAHAAFSVFILRLFKSSYGVLLYRHGKLRVSRTDKQLPGSSDISRMDRRV
jgi:hypothetical protein